MAFDVIKFYQAHRINYTTRGKKSTKGWVQTRCPFCHSTDYHLGSHINTGAFNCWKCGKHKQTDTIKELLGISFGEANEIRKKYSTDSEIKTYVGVPEKPTRTLLRACPYPCGTSELKPRHKAYIASRKFNPERIIKLWGIRATEAVGKYKWRVIIPIMYEGKMVSYQGRDITGKSDLKYKACIKEEELINHQHLVYGIDNVVGECCVVVEGVFDVWRLGYGAVCCFGISYTMQQVNLIAKRFKKVFILFDTEDRAQLQAQKMGVLLTGRGVDVEILELEGAADPADMEQREANQLMKELGLRE